MQHVIEISSSCSHSRYVECSCGERFYGGTAAEAEGRHAGHAQEEQLRQALRDVHDGWIDAVNGRGVERWDGAWELIYPAIRDGLIKTSVTDEGLKLTVVPRGA